jgi:GAF domain-containing protein
MLVGDGSPVPDKEKAIDKAGSELPELILPVKAHDQVVGTIQAHKSTLDEEWAEAEIELMRSLADQLSVALESARLYQDTQRSAARDRLLSEVTSRVRETLDMDTVLQTAVREIGQALNLAEVEVRMGPPTTERLTAGVRS